MGFEVGFLGAGHMSEVHSEILAADPRVSLCGFFDTDVAKSEALASRRGAKRITSLERLMDECEAVYICTPNTTHYDLALQAIGSGKHVFCEKPFALGIEPARRLRHEAAKSGRIFQVGHNRRFAPVYKALKNSIESGRITPLSVHAKMNRGDLAEPPWIWDAAITGGFLYETPVHMLDLMIFFFGEIEWVETAARAHEHGQLDDFSILMGFKSGLFATLKSFGHASWHFPFERMEVFGHHSTYETFEMERISITQGLKGKTMTSDFSALPHGEKWGYAGEDALFIDALEGKSACAVTAEDGFRSVELIEACYQSARVGQRVFLPL
ncbi:MAG: Gfo/Idh/MocA family protein [Terriglobia bacterium]